MSDAIHPTLELKDITQAYKQGDSELRILNNTNLVVKPGEMVALIGPSGAGKSTLLHLAGLLEHPKSGEVFINARPTTQLNENERTQVRGRDIGFVYQFHHLLAELTALENVMMPQLIMQLPKAEATARATQLLTYLGLKERLMHRPSELSGGEQQRVAIARALANAPRLILADEPTGNLDARTAAQVFELFVRVVSATGVAAIIATHDMALAAKLTRRITLIDQKIVELG